jgi:hypothetical protein
MPWSCTKCGRLHDDLGVDGGGLRDRVSAGGLAKLERYAHFFTGFATTLLREDDTWYARSFKDAWRAEVPFVTQSQARRDSIAKLIDSFAPGRVSARAMTVGDAQRNLRRALYGADALPMSNERARTASAVATPPRLRPPPVSPALSAAEERLRRGRVAVRGEQLANFERALRGSLAALASAQRTRSVSDPPDSIPTQPAGASESSAFWANTPAAAKRRFRFTTSLLPTECDQS